MKRMLVAGLCAVLIGAGCGAGSADDAVNDSRRDSITLGFTLEPTSLDISGTAGQSIPQVLLDNVYEGLVRVDENGAIVAALAEQYSVSDDGLSYTFTLRDARFHDGSVLSAEDVVWSLNRVLDDATTAVLPTQVAQFAKVSSIAANDDVVTLTLIERDNDLLYNLTQRGGVIFKKDTTDFASTAIGTGPFVFAKWDKGNSITLERFDDYWGRRADTKTVIFRYFADATALSNAMLAGDIDVMTTVQSPENLEVFKAREDLKVLSGSTNCEVTLGMNNSRAPFNDVSVRKAVRQALDKRSLIDAAWGGYGTEIGSFVPPTDPWFEDLTDVAPFNVNAARDAIAGAGLVGTEVKLDVPPINYATNSSEFIAAALADVGLQVSITPVTWEEWLDRVFTKADYDLTIVCHIERNDMAIYANPEYYFRFDNAEYRDLIAAASNAATQDDRVSALRSAARLLSEQSASDWLWLIPNLQVAKREIAGVVKNSVGDSYYVARVERV
ncbi:MAG: ABC transporter substrate-binding protein [Actinobacteria bacterium]|nr:ABC transporter substrate-binding protein [Actinomycetota bacterium]MBM3816601.1 ABC transporter substrate-binding protein [Actinomycetota bacterium]